jgi:hypothetical protein
MNPALMQELSKEGKAINWTEIERMLFDMMAYRSAEGIFRDMSDEEKQALNQPPMTEQIRMQMQRERLMGQKDIAEDKQLAAMTHDLLKGTQQHQNTLSENEQQSLNNTKQSLMEIAAQAKANPKPQGGEAT